MARRAPGVSILKSDDHLVVVDKAAGVPSVRERWDTETKTVLDLAQAQIEKGADGPVKLRTVHRLDKDTSGVILLARTAEAGRSLSGQFRDRTVEKTYLALIAGAPYEPEGVIEARIDQDPKRPGAMRIVKHRGKAARTAWASDERFRGFALLRVTPATGRTHQIRVHLAHAGMPLAIDPLYGGERTGIFLSELKRRYKPSRKHEERPLIGRLTLHAWRLTFDHPVSGDRVTVEAPLPKDLSLVLRDLRRFQAI